MMSHEQLIYSSIAAMLQQECANLIDSLIKIMVLDSDDVAASKNHNPYCR
jgi:hypothetical protein